VARDRSEVVLAATNVALFAGALIALAAGAPAHRVRPFAVFSTLGTAATLYVEVVRALAGRRARAQASSSPPRGVRLRKPLWLSASDGASLIMFGAPLAALAGLAGFTTVGVGVVLTAVALSLAGYALAGTFDARALTFEDGSLRVHMRTATFSIPWAAVVDVTRSGSGGRLVRLRFAGRQAVLGSVTPATDRARSRAWLMIGGQREPTNEVTFAPWTAGLDGAALARALTAASTRGPSRAN
jgi:hypothetical protein